jgi:Putative Flp pilus-assembly TadE/G-like
MARVISIKPALDAFARDENGAMTVLALIMTVMLLGFGALVADIGRLYNLHSQMQSYVDQVALAAAAELDGDADAIERAQHAALGDGTNPPLVRDVQNFAVGAAELAIQAPEFYRQIPPTTPRATKPCSPRSPQRTLPWRSSCASARHPGRRTSF